MSENPLIRFTESMAMIQQEKDQIKKTFNPKNEAIHVLKVIQKKDMKTLRPWIGAVRIDKKRTEEYGSPQYEKVPPTARTHALSEKDRNKAGPQDAINYVDPDMIDPETDLPMWRTFKKGEVFLAVDTNASHMLFHEFAISVSEFKNEKDPETEKVRFEWADEDEIISDENGILILKYHEQFSRDATAIMTIAARLLSAEDEISELKAKIEGGKNGK